MDTLRLIRSLNPNIRIIKNPSSPYIRWGCTAWVLQDESLSNGAEAIRLASNKAAARDVLGWRGVSIPKTYHTPTEVIDSNHESYVHRPIRHYGGIGFWHGGKAEAARKLSLGGYVSEYIDKDRELRLHVAHGKVLLIQEKPVVAGVACSNHAVTGARFTILKRDAWSPKLCRESIKAVDALGLDFGAVDIILKGKNHYVLEVNTAPRITSEFVAAKYAKYIAFLDRHQGAGHWDCSSPRKGKAFAWTERDFES